MNLTAEEKTQKTLPRISKKEADDRNLLTEQLLTRLHLAPTAAPVAETVTDGGEHILYFDPNRVKEAPLSLWYQKRPRFERKEGEELPRITPREAEGYGFYSEEHLAAMYYKPTEAPIARIVRRDGTEIPLFDRATCLRLPMPCIRCGKGERYRGKLCIDCYRKELAEKRAVGDAKRAAYYGKDPRRVIFFDLEMTGVFERDEVLSISLVNGLGETVYDTLVKPRRAKRWPKTEKIHGITPEMVKDAPTADEVGPVITDILEKAEKLIAFGTSTDFIHLKRLYATRTERDRLHGKIIDCATEFSHYLEEHEIDLVHRSLSDAMETLHLRWDGTAHTSCADAHACRLVFETLFPHYYERKVD